MGTLRETLEAQPNPFLDTVISHLEDLELLMSVEGDDWDGEEGTYLLRIQPIIADNYGDLKELAIERLRKAAKETPFTAACMEVILQNVPNMVFKLTQTQ